MPAECSPILIEVAGIGQDAVQHLGAAQACGMICMQMQQALLTSSQLAELQHPGFRVAVGKRSLITDSAPPKPDPVGLPHLRLMMAVEHCNQQRARSAFGHLPWNSMLLLRVSQAEQLSYQSMLAQTRGTSISSSRSVCSAVL